MAHSKSDIENLYSKYNKLAATLMLIVGGIIVIGYIQENYFSGLSKRFDKQDNAIEKLSEKLDIVHEIKSEVKYMEKRLTKVEKKIENLEN